MAGARFEHPYYPIIYVRGYAGTDSDIEDTVSDPYMGFNLGSTRIRTLWTGDTERYYFESPLVRMMKDFGYRDVYSAGLNITEIDEVPPGTIEPRSITIYRYYDQVSSVFGRGKQVAMEDFGRGLSELIIKLRDRICADDEAQKADFKVYLVGHSMGGLVIRCFLQNDKIGTPAARKCVDKVFTYATPHNGIELEIIGNVPSFFTAQSADNFNRQRMLSFLGLPAGTDKVNTLNGKFDVDRFFCLIGTNPKDYTVASGWSARLVGPFSDGLVRTDNATVFDGDEAAGTSKLAPRAYVYRSHSGYYGIVNSEEGYQNLTRFLFGDVRIDGSLEVRDITLPSDVEQARLAGKQIRASYQFEVVARVRGAHWDLSRRLANENSAVFRKYGELFPERATEGIDHPNRRNPVLFNVHLDDGLKVNSRRASMGFSIDLGVLVPDYQVDGMLWLNNHYPGGYIFRDKLNLEATPPKTDKDSWQLRYGFDSRTPNRATTLADGTATDDKLEFRIPIVQKNRPGIDATLLLSASVWNAIKA
jgi:PGAP1-like protein